MAFDLMRDFIRRCVNPAALAVGFIMLASCATTQRDDAVIDSPALNPNEGIVFFSVAPRVFTPDGEKFAPGTEPLLRYTWSYSQLLSAEEKARSIVARFKAVSGAVDGSTRAGETFYSRRLPAGAYSLSSLVVTTGTDARAYKETSFRFTVEPNKATYLGLLRLDFRGSAKSKSTDKATEFNELRITVVDEYENAKTTFKSRNPGIGCEIAANMMNN